MRRRVRAEQRGGRGAHDDYHHDTVDHDTVEDDAHLWTRRVDKEAGIDDARVLWDARAKAWEAADATLEDIYGQAEGSVRQWRASVGQQQATSSSLIRGSDNGATVPEGVPHQQPGLPSPPAHIDLEYAALAPESELSIDAV